ncbi:MAG: hypothetical protein RL095_3454 [Verrucomicrobiota bacterium]|jgi:pimeloyl-ACP methyl ester carboxylesterase
MIFDRKAFLAGFFGLSACAYERKPDEQKSGHGEGRPAYRESRRIDGMGREYWLYTPETIDPLKTFWLVVGVHPHKGRGRGAMGLASWAATRSDVIVVGPTFPCTGPFYQLLEGETPRQLNAIQDALSKEFKLHPRFFIHGYSGGAQFAHRYASLHPERLIACSAHSAGTWSAPDPKAKSLLWALSCGIGDTAESVPGSGRRIDNFRRFAAQLHDGGFAAKAFTRPGDHSRHAIVGKTALETFITASTGIFPWQQSELVKVAADQREVWIAVHAGLAESSFDDGATKHKLQRNPDSWTLNPEALAQMKATRAAASPP